MEQYITGFIIGLSLAFSVGPAFIGIFQKALSHGMRQGLMFSLGIWLSDLCVFSVTFYWAFLFLDNCGNQQFIAITGGMALLVFGLSSLFKKPDNSLHRKIRKTSTGVWNNLLRGFLFNIANPFAYIFWLGVNTIASSVHNISGSIDFFLLFAGVFTSGYSVDILKCYMAGVMGKKLHERVLLRLNQLAGAIIILAGIYIFVFRGLIAPS